MISAARPVLIIGGGNMGSALACGWVTAFGAAAVIIAENDKSKRHALESELHIQTCSSEELALHALTASAIILAVKPDAALSVTASLSRLDISENTPLISIAAGVELARYETAFGRAHPIIRAMPNIGVQVAHGVTACIVNDAAQHQHQTLATTLFEAVGTCYWLDDELQMHAITAISGSGPAYVFYFMECLIEAAKNLGLPEHIVAPLVCHTVHGSTILAQQHPDKINDLRVSVTSPKGTTQAALEVLSVHLPNLIKTATEHAANRSKELTQI
jgi:pyrroline-5-carboxylate reductase